MCDTVNDALLFARWLVGQIEVTDRDWSMSSIGHVEIGLAAERVGVDRPSISDMPFDSFYFTPSQRTCLGAGAGASLLPMHRAQLLP